MQCISALMQIVYIIFPISLCSFMVLMFLNISRSQIFEKKKKFLMKNLSVSMSVKFMIRTALFIHFPNGKIIVKWKFYSVLADHSVF